MKSLILLIFLFLISCSDPVKTGDGKTMQPIAEDGDFGDESSDVEAESSRESSDDEEADGKEKDDKENDKEQESVDGLPNGADAEKVENAVSTGLVSTLEEAGCDSCHANTAPQFFDEDEGFAKTVATIDFEDSESSTLYTKIVGGHNCGDDDECTETADAILDNIEEVITASE